MSGIYRMPGEFEEHHGTLMIFPTRPGSWNYGGAAAQKVFAQIMAALLPNEEVYLLCGREHMDLAKRAVPDGVRIVQIESDDAWARDVGPTFVKTADGKTVGIDWRFNAWGGDHDGLYQHYERDDKLASAFCDALGYDRVDAHPFVLEGGSIHSDGQGTILTTERCLLSPGRNPHMTKSQIEKTLCAYLGGEKVIWLPRGIYGDETNEHVDNICAFVRPGEVIVSVTDDENDPQYALSQSCLDVLKNSVDARGRRFKIYTVPIPKKPVLVTQEDLLGYEFEEGEDVRAVGDRLAASYVNFYIANNIVLLPQFGDEHDQIALSVLREAFPERRVIPIFARDILLGGGNIHCVTQQIPK